MTGYGRAMQSCRLQIFKGEPSDHKANICLRFIQRNFQAKGTRTTLAGVKQEPKNTVSSIDLERVCVKVDPVFAGSLPSLALTGLT